METAFRAPGKVSAPNWVDPQDGSGKVGRGSIHLFRCNRYADFSHRDLLGDFRSSRSGRCVLGHKYASWERQHRQYSNREGQSDSTLERFTGRSIKQTSARGFNDCDGKNQQRLLKQPG